MEFTKEFFHTLFSTYIYYLLLYSSIAGIFYMIFWYYKKGTFSMRRIQLRQRAGHLSITREVKYSISTLTIFTVMDFGIYVASQHGYTQIYGKIADRGLLYLLINIMVMLIIHDTYFYWVHRFMHWKVIYKKVHHVHHQSIDPSPLAAFAFHPLEALLEASVYIVYTMVVPVHMYTLISFQIIMTILNAIGHLGYEIYPAGFTKNKFWRWKTTSTHHNMHHEKFNGNYGLYFTYWDKLFNTEFKDYDEVFEKTCRPKKTLMKEKSTIILSMLFFLGSTLASDGQEINKNSVVGTWLVQDKDATVSIYQNGNKYDGKISWLQTPLDNNKIAVKDSNNSNPELRKKSVLGLNILKNFEFTSDKTWENGTIYDPKNGRTYSCKITMLENDRLHIRGFIGFSLLGRTEVWTKK